MDVVLSIAGLYTRRKDGAVQHRNPPLSPAHRARSLRSACAVATLLSAAESLLKSIPLDTYVHLLERSLAVSGSPPKRDTSICPTHWR